MARGICLPISDCSLKKIQTNYLSYLGHHLVYLIHYQIKITLSVVFSVIGSILGLLRQGTLKKPLIVSAKDNFAIFYHKLIT